MAISTPSSPSDAGSNPAETPSSGFFASVFNAIGDMLPTAKADEGDDDKEEGGDEGGDDAGGEEEEEEEEPEDEAPKIREDCEEKACKEAKHHFDHCQEKVSEGHHKGEDCVEELFHLMHCVDTCATPKIFSKLV